MNDEFDFKKYIEFFLKYFFIDVKTELSSFLTYFVFHHWYFHTFEIDRIVINQFVMIIVTFAVFLKNMFHYMFIQKRFLSHCDHVFSFIEKCMQKELFNDTNHHWQNNAYHWLKILYSDQSKMKKAKDMYMWTLAKKKKH